MGWLISDLFPAPLVERLRRGDEQFVVTGATGWFGTMTLGLLDEIYGDETANRVHAYATRAREVRTHAGRRVLVQSLDSLAQLSIPGPCLHFLHFAFAVPARAVTDAGDASTQANASLVDLVCASLSSLRPAGFCYPSSGAVYGRWSPAEAASEYARQKAADELAFRERCSALGSKIVIPRVFAVGGPCSADPQRYLLGELVQRALARRPLVLRSAHRVFRSYVSLADVLALVLTELLRGDRDEVIFDAAGDEVVEAAELAQRVREVLGRADLPIIREHPDPLEPARHPARSEDDRYVGDPSAMQSIASAWGYAIAPLDDVIRQTALA